MTDRKKPIILENGKLRTLAPTEELDSLYQFSFKKLEGRNVLIPQDQQMIVVGDCVLEDSDLTLEGDLCLI